MLLPINFRTARTRRVHRGCDTFLRGDIYFFVLIFFSSCGRKKVCEIGRETGVIFSTAHRIPSSSSRTDPSQLLLSLSFPRFWWIFNQERNFTRGRGKLLLFDHLDISKAIFILVLMSQPIMNQTIEQKNMQNFVRLSTHRLFGCLLSALMNRKLYKNKW